MKKTQKLKEAVQGLMDYATENSPYGCMNRPEPEEEYKELQALKVLATELFEDKQWKEDVEEQLAYFDDEDHKEFGEFNNMSLKQSLEHLHDRVTRLKSDYDEENPEDFVDLNNDLKFVEQEFLNESE